MHSNEQIARITDRLNKQGFSVSFVGFEADPNLGRLRNTMRLRTADGKEYNVPDAGESELSAYIAAAKYTNLSDE
jgi:hypothetical protein